MRVSDCTRLDLFCVLLHAKGQCEELLDLQLSATTSRSALFSAQLLRMSPLVCSGWSP